MRLRSGDVSVLAASYVVGAAVALSLLGAAPALAQQRPTPPNQPSLELQAQLANGWNTWSVTNVLTHVLLPEGLAISLVPSPHGDHRAVYPVLNRPQFVGTDGVRDGERGYVDLSDINQPAQVRLGAHAEDGSYTALTLEGAHSELRVETAAEGRDLVVLVHVTRAERDAKLYVEYGLLWNRPGRIERVQNILVATTPTTLVTLRAVNRVVADRSLPTRGPYLTIPLAEGPIGLYTGPARTLAEIEALLAQRRAREAQRVAAYGRLGPAFRVLQQSLAWNTVFVPERDSVLTCPSRRRAASSGGWILAGPEGYLAAWMLAQFSKTLALNAAVQVTKGLTPGGFVPQAQSGLGVTLDRSQPPLGAAVVRELYRRYPERWFIEEVFDELLTWNRWWPRARGAGALGEYLAYGSDPTSEPLAGAAGTWEAACAESGLARSPMYAEMPFNEATSRLELADVGLLSLYVLDCEALADLARVLGRPALTRELDGRARLYSRALATLWNDSAGTFMNRRLDTGAFVPRLSPTVFYPLLTAVPTPKQAERMVREHLLNPDEFRTPYLLPSCPRNDPLFGPQYGRGRVGGLQNLLVYLGLRRHSGAVFDEARRLLIETSLQALTQNDAGLGCVFEHTSALTGRGDDVSDSDSYDHAGALLGFLSLIEQGHVPSPLEPLPPRR